MTKIITSALEMTVPESQVLKLPQLIPQLKPNDMVDVYDTSKKKSIPLNRESMKRVAQSLRNTYNHINDEKCGPQCVCNKVIPITLKDYHSGKLVKVYRKNVTLVKIRLTREPLVFVRTIIGKPAYAINFEDKNLYHIKNFDSPLPPLASLLYHVDYHVQYITLCEEGCPHIFSEKFHSYQEAKARRDEILDYPRGKKINGKEVVLPDLKFHILFLLLEKLLRLDESKLLAKHMRFFRGKLGV